MTKGQIFKKAHKIAREIRVMFKNYKTAFSIALKRVYRELRSEDIQAVKEIKEQAQVLLGEVINSLEMISADYKELKREVRISKEDISYKHLFKAIALEEKINKTVKNIENTFTVYIDEEVILYDRIKEHNLSESLIEGIRGAINDIIGYYNSTYKLIDCIG